MKKLIDFIKVYTIIMISEGIQTPIFEISTIGKNNMEGARALSEKEASLASVCAVPGSTVHCRGYSPI